MTTPTPEPTQRPSAALHLGHRGYAWALQRALLGLVVLLTVAFGAAVLLDASIDRDGVSASEE